MFSVESEISVGVRSFYVPLCTEDFSHRQSDDYQQMLTVLGDSIYCVTVYSFCSVQFLILTVKSRVSATSKITNVK